MWILNNKSAHVLEWFLWALNATHQKQCFLCFVTITWAFLLRIWMTPTCLRKDSGTEALSTQGSVTTVQLRLQPLGKFRECDHHPIQQAHTLLVNNDRTYSLSLICSLVNSRYAESSKCRTLLVTGRVRVICSRRVSKVYISLVLYRIERNLTFIEHGHVKISTFLIPYRIGDIVDIKANAAQQKGMPHKFYHGSAFVTFSGFTIL